MVNKMRFSKIMVMCMTLYAIFFLPTYAAFEGKISVVEDRNISFNMISESGYNISKNISVAMVVQAVSINSTEPMGKNASIMIMSMNIVGDGSQSINQSEFSSFMEAMFMGTIKLTNGKEIATTMVNSSQGKNVALHTILMPAPKNMPANESTIAFWDLDEYNHAILTSEMDLNNTTQIVETLKLLP
jgi:hypothetical protein